MGCVWVYLQKMDLYYRWEYGDKSTRINWQFKSADLEEKCLL